MKVTNFKNKNGKAIVNQFIITSFEPEDVETGIGTQTVYSTVKYFQSYDSIIVKTTDSETYLDTKYWEYSPTTNKYRNIFLNETSAETKRKIESGEYILTNLN